jgi:hypothetical protein
VAGVPAPGSLEEEHALWMMRKSITAPLLDLITASVADGNGGAKKLQPWHAAVAAVVLLNWNTDSLLLRAENLTGAQKARCFVRRVGADGQEIISSSVAGCGKAHRLLSPKQSSAGVGGDEVPLEERKHVTDKALTKMLHEACFGSGNSRGVELYEVGGDVALDPVIRFVASILSGPAQLP